LKKTFLTKFIVIIIGALLLPFGLYTLYQITQRNENEALIQQIFSRQLENILFSINQNCWDIFNSWTIEISSNVQLSKNQNFPKDTEDLLQAFFRQQSIKGIYLNLSEKEPLLIWSPQYELKKTSLADGHIISKINSYVRTSIQKSGNLMEYTRQNYIQPLIINGSDLADGLRDLSLFLFPLRESEKVTKSNSIGGIFLSIDSFIQHIVIQQLQTIDEENFIFAIHNSNNNETVYLSNYNSIIEPGPTRENHLTAVPLEILGKTGPFEKSEKLWLLPGFQLQVRLKGDTLADIARTRTNRNLIFLVGVNILLVLGALLLLMNIYKEMKLARMKTDFVANVSHELRTPLALISLYTETLDMDRITSESKKHVYYKTIMNESARLTKLINNILDFSKIESKKLEYHFEETNLRQLIEKIVKIYSFHLDQKGFKYVLDLAKDLPPVLVDGEAIELVFTNILDNAIKFSRKQKEIFIRLLEKDNALMLSVEDKGLGISASEHKHIFDKFYRIENSLVTDTKGSGLGLSLVKHIMEMHQGQVTVESNPGVGSTFTLIFPLPPVSQS
jgi:two-component system phosphate regulon sensor histidine kinase PhoR